MDLMNLLINEKDNIKKIKKIFIEINFAIDDYYKRYNSEQLGKFYQIKRYIRDINIDFGKMLFNIFLIYCKDNLFRNGYLNTFMLSDKR